MASKRTVEFDAHKKVKKSVEVTFETKSGKEVDFIAQKKVGVPVHVKFRAQPKE